MYQPTIIDDSEKLLKPEIGVSRFLCGMLMHYALTDYIRVGLDMMKFAINHPWKFMDPHTAYLCGFMKVNVNFLVALLSYNLLLTSETVVNCLWNFLGLSIIRRLGDYIYGAIRHSEEKKQIQDPKFQAIFTIQTTTSSQARAKIDAHKLEFDEILPEELKHLYPEYIMISFWDRKFFNKLEYLVYICIKCGY